MRMLSIGKSVSLRLVEHKDAAFILGLRLDPIKGKHLSHTKNNLDDQIKFIKTSLEDYGQYYFIIVDNALGNPLGTVRLYDFQGDSFCWGSWIVADNAPSSTALQSALLVYDFAFYALHFKKSHFDVRKGNSKVLNFHTRMGARLYMKAIQTISFIMIYYPTPQLGIGIPNFYHDLKQL